MKTNLHTYSFYMDRDREAYGAMLADIKADGPRHWMNSWGGNDSTTYAPGITTETVELETDFVFSNQWNTADGRRVFDHYEEYPAIISKKCKRGHWLEVTDEMREFRRNQNVCGYCGHREQAQKGLVFCDKCLDSPYLKESDLKLLRMQSCGIHTKKFPELTEAELAHLLPLYTERQTTGKGSRNAQKLRKQRVDLHKERDQSVKVAETKCAGMAWLMDNGVSIDNCIYYSHTDKFSFGWRSPVSDAVKSNLLDILVEFPYEYEIKAA